MKSNFKSIATLLAVLPLSCMTLYAQKKGGKVVETDNLIENGSFESTTGKIKKLGSIDLATGWSSPTGARADLFIPSDKLPDIGTPKNVYGKEDPKEGSNYAGIVGYSYGDKMPRTYLMTKLKAPLKKGQKYCVQFYLSLAELSKYSANEIGVVLSKKPFGTDTKSSIIEKTNVLHTDNKIFNAHYGWEKVCNTFTADGGEKYITIGNFSNNDQTKNERNKKIADFKGTPIIAAYYFIDDVSVIMPEEGKKCDCSNKSGADEFSTTIYQRAILLDDKMTAAEKINAQASFFAFGKNMLQPVAVSSLDLIAELLIANPSYKLEITGYNDPNEKEMSKENPLYENMDLKRVEVVVRYLEDKGISKERLVKKIMGSEGINIEVEEGDEEDLIHAKTRRVAYLVIE